MTRTENNRYISDILLVYILGKLNKFPLRSQSKILGTITSAIHKVSPLVNRQLEDCTSILGMGFHLNTSTNGYEDVQIFQEFSFYFINLCCFFNYEVPIASKIKKHDCNND